MARSFASNRALVRNSLNKFIVLTQHELIQRFRRHRQLDKLS